MKKIGCFLLVLLLTCSMAACSSPDAGTSSAASSTSSSVSASSTSPASSSAPTSAEKSKLVFWFEGAGPERTVIHEKIISDFNAQSDSITIEGVYSDLATVQERVNVAWAGKAMPDVLYINGSNWANVIVQGMVTQLDERFDAWDEHDQFNESNLEFMRSMDVENRLFGIPTATNISGIWYRKDVFNEKGLAPPTTWDNFFTAVTALSDAPNTYGFTLRGGQGSPTPLTNMLLCYTGYEDYWSEDGKAQILRSPEALEFITRYAAIFQNGECPESSLTAGFNEMIADFNAGIAMTMVHNLGSYENQRQTFTPDQYGFYPFPPSVKGNIIEEVADGKGISIPVTTPYADEAWEFIKYYCSMESISAINESSGELPTRKDSAQQDWVKNAPHMSNLPDYFAQTRIPINPPRYMPEYASILNEYAMPTFQEVLTGITTPQDFLNGWADRVEASYQEYMANI